jgi:hypothetical protein
MKYLLNGVAIAAAMVIAAPVWAQAPAPAKPAAPAMAPAAAAPAAAPAKAMPMTQMHKKPMRMAKRHWRGAPADSATEQLNRNELARLQGGGAPPPMMPSGENAGAGQGGPRASGH